MELFLTNGLGEVGGEAKAFKAAGITPLSQGGHHDQDRVSNLRVGLD